MSAKDANYIKKMFRQNCSVTSLTILVESAFEAVVPTLFELAQYTCTDIMKMRGGHTWGVAATAFKEIGVQKRRSGVRRHGRCGRRMGAVRQGKNAFGPGFIDGFKFIYEITGTALFENLLFKFFLFELGEQFIANWMTLAYAAEGCDLPPAGTIWTDWGALFTPGPEREITCTIGPGSTHCAHSGGSEIIVEPGCVASISWTGRWVPFRNDPTLLGPVSMWLEDDDGKRWDQTDAPVRPGQNYINQGGGFYKIPGKAPFGTAYRLKAMIHGGLMGPADLPHTTLAINTTGKPVKIFPQGGCGKSLGYLADEMWGYLDQPHMVDAFSKKILNPWLEDIDKFIKGKPVEPLI